MITKNSFQIVCSKSVFAVVALGLASTAFAAAFKPLEQSITNLGNAYAGTAAYASDASTGYYNPAGLANLTESQISLSLGYSLADSKLTAKTATDVDSSNLLLGTQNPYSPDEKNFLSGFHAAWVLNDSVNASLNIVTPYALNTEYERTSFARAISLQSEITTINVSPSVSYKINKELALGAGIDWLRLDIKLQNQPSTGFVENQGDGDAFGYHLGMMWQPSSAIRMGLTYNSAINIDAEGRRSGDNILFLTAIKLPNTLTYSVLSIIDENWVLMADLQWTHWSRMEDLTLRYADNTTSIEKFNYANTWRFALGADYKPSNYINNVILKFGAAYEQSPTVDAYRSARIPDGDRWWFSLGLHWYVNRNLSFDFGYSYISVNDVSINQNSAGAVFAGNYESLLHVFGAQVNWKFI